MTITSFLPKMKAFVWRSKRLCTVIWEPMPGESGYLSMVTFLRVWLPRIKKCDRAFPRVAKCSKFVTYCSPVSQLSNLKMFRFTFTGPLAVFNGYQMLDVVTGNREQLLQSLGEFIRRKNLRFWAVVAFSILRKRRIVKTLPGQLSFVRNRGLRGSDVFGFVNPYTSPSVVVQIKKSIHF